MPAQHAPYSPTRLPRIASRVVAIRVVASRVVASRVVASRVVASRVVASRMLVALGMALALGMIAVPSAWSVDTDGANTSVSTKTGDKTGDKPGGESVSFSSEVLPLLSAKCFACHGPDEAHREGELRLDDRQAAIDSGAIVPGDAKASELVERILSDDDSVRMPPADEDHGLSDQQRKLLIEWIESGAAYSRHWAFVPPHLPPVPSVGDPSWPLNPIDCFVLRQLEDAGLQPSPDADRITLVRRLYIDLLGVLPTPEQADAFVNDARPDAYQRLVDRLLQSPDYGQRWARKWLDLVRYADTNGYEKDRPRSIWPYRDWVIQAINDDMPYDQFSVEQIAGDMLPGATLNQRIATGMHRNTMLNEEGGIDPLEYRFYAMVDRVATTGTIWMGLTTGCAQCHTHKYDPITQVDYYQMMALLNNADEPDLILPDPQTTQKRNRLQRQIDASERRLTAQVDKQLTSASAPASESAQPSESAKNDQSAKNDESAKASELDSAWQQWLTQQRAALVDWQTIRPRAMNTNLPSLELMPDGSLFASGDTTKRDIYDLGFEFNQPTTITAIRLEALPDDRLPARGPGMAYYEGRKGDFFLSELTIQHGGSPVAIASGSMSYGNLSVGSGTVKATNVWDGDGSTGWSTSGAEGQASELVLVLDQPLTVSGELSIRLLFERHFVASLGRFRFSITDRQSPAEASALPPETRAALRIDPSGWTPEQRQAVMRSFFAATPLLESQYKPIEKLRSQLPDLPVTLVMRERRSSNPRPTHRHHRGEYTSPRELVQPRLPSLFENASAAVGDRLSFARWLVSDENPMAGRVTVNRQWREFFGAGLVRTNGDFGTQSNPPTHPQLLDWLAVQWSHSGPDRSPAWSMKQLHRMIVTSHTYRQQSITPAALAARDPENRLLARGPRFRVDGELVRDLMLSASGLLSSTMYGPSVYPPQPASVTALAYGNTSWNASPGEDRYRRSLYTFSKRTAPFASYSVFDAPTGENCVARRDRSNTPLQALTLLNDPMFLEYAAALAATAMTRVGGDIGQSNDGQSNDGQTDATEVATDIFRRVLTRSPSDSERDALLQYQRQQLARIIAGEIDADKIVPQTGSPPWLAASQRDPKRHAQLRDAWASWTLVARAIMNLDAAITKP